jgi:hypothetical protein
MKYIAKPNLFNFEHSKTFKDAKSAVIYLNDKLSDKGVSEHLDYMFIAPKATDSQLKFAISEYVGIGKLIIQE